MTAKFPSFLVLSFIAGTAQAIAQDVNMAMLPGGSESLWRGTQANAMAGASLDQGNLSSDSRRDLIIGAPGSGSTPGKVYVIFGGTVRQGDLSLASADVIINGTTGSDRFGTSTAAGNIRTTEASNSPRDVAIGAPGVLAGRGAVFLFATGGGFPTATTRNANNAGGADGYTVRILGRPGDQLGTALATIDVNNDGFRDIVAGAPGNNRIYIIKGGTSVTAGGTIDLTTVTPNLLTIVYASDITVADQLGRVFVAGDVTGEGVADLVMSAPQEAGGAGRVYLLAGRSDGLLGNIDLAVSATAVFTGAGAGDLSGFSLALPDFDADGTKDIAIGAPAADPGGRINAGAVYVIWGGTGLTSRNLTASNVTFWGETSGIQVGAFVTSGSVNRDGPDDIVMLAYGARGDQGELQMYYGGSRASRNGVRDLALGFARRLYASPSPGLIRTAFVFEVTGEGARDVIAGVPTASGGAGVNQGLVYFSLSPRMRLSSQSLSVRASRLSPRSTVLQVSNPGVGTVTWTASANVPWVTVSPMNGQSTAGTPGNITLTVPATATPGRLTGTITVRSTSPDLTMTLTVPFAMVCCQSISDYDGDGKADLGVYRPSGGTWHVRYSSQNYSYAGATQYQWGVGGDQPLQADFDGDGKGDLAIYRPSTGEWLVRYSSDAFSYATWTSYQWGVSGDVPLVTDFDGDTKTDLVVYRPSNGNWYIRYSSSNYGFSDWTAHQWGLPGDSPVVADFDGDGKTDLVVYRPSSGDWFVRYSSDAFSFATWTSYQWGLSGDAPLAADFDGDGKTDLAVFRPGDGTWYIRFSASGYSFANWMSFQWGVAGDIPIAADFDGDGKADISVYRPSTGEWFTRYSSMNWSVSGFGTNQWGVSGDMPLVPR
jgi:hypothetical protein